MFLEEAINNAKQLVLVFENANVKLLRMGLHPSEELSNEKSLLAGPFHPAFGQLVYSDIWKDIFKKKLAGLNFSEKDEIIIEIAPSQINAAIGNQGSNNKYFSRKFASVGFKSNSSLKNRECNILVK